MLILIIGIVLFLGVHVFGTLRARRAAVIARFGEDRYKLGYTIVSLIGFALIVWGFGQYRAAGMIPVWEPPHWMRHLAMPLVLFAFVALASRRAPPGRLVGLLRHPMLVAIKAWALAHLLVNGDLGSMILFGSFLAFAVYDRIAVKKRGDMGASGTTAFTKGDAIAVGAGAAVFGVVLMLHPYLFGVAVVG